MRKRGGGISLLGVLYVFIGIAVAGFRDYLVGWNVIGNIIEGLLAIVLWPVVLFGVDLHGLIP
jgi:hypothetical protein